MPPEEEPNPEPALQIPMHGRHVREVDVLLERWQRPISLCDTLPSRQMDKLMDSSRASYRLALMEPASGGGYCSTQGQISAIEALLDGAIAVMESSLLSCRVSACGMNTALLHQG